MTESIQKRLMRVRPPRVRITYDVETGGAMEKEELPFIVGILADLQGDLPEETAPVPMAERRILDIDRDTFDDVMRKIGPGVKLDLSQEELRTLKESTDDADKFLRFGAMSDFEPIRLVQAIPSLRSAYLARNQVRWLQAKAESNLKVGEVLERWLKFEAAGDDKRKQAVRAELSALLKRGRPNDERSTELRAALLVLLDKMQDYWTAQANAQGTPVNSDERTALATAQTNALNELKKWRLQADATAKEPVKEETLLGWGGFLATAMALEATPENEKASEAFLKLLKEAEADGAAGPDVDERKRLRAALSKQLGYESAEKAQEPAGAWLAGIDTGDTATRNRGLGKALLLAGLQQPTERAKVPQPQHLDIDAVAKKYQNDCIAAESRGMFLGLLDYLYQATPAEGVAVDENSGDKAAEPAKETLLAIELFQMVTLLRPTKLLTMPAIVYRLWSFVSEIMRPWQNDDQDLLKGKKQGISAVIDLRVAQIDRSLSAALSAIMHQPTFRKLEASWRGLRYLVFKSETGTMLKLKVFNATKDELRKDMESAVEFDQSSLFKMIYEAEYGTFGGFPYSLLVGDYEIGTTAEDIEFVKRMAEVAAAAHAPFIAAASASLFGLESFDALAMPRDLAKIFESKELESWHEFRAMEDARYVTLVLPRTLLRLPYGRPDKRNTITAEGLNFEERVAPKGQSARYSPQDPEVPLSYPRPDTENFLWGNAAWVLAERITNAFTLYGWTAAIRGVEGGGLVEGLPLYSYTSDAGTTELFCPTEVTITDRREKELSDLGFMALCHCKGTSNAAFFGGQTTNAPKTYFSPDANANARLSSMLPYMLAASRFAHYIKVIMRKKVGMFMTRANVESYLNNWIAHYVLLDDNAPQDAKASFPLRAANVVVTEVPGEPGRYNATVFLKPHFQLEELSTSIRLVATLPAA